MVKNYTNIHNEKGFQAKMITGSVEQTIKETVAFHTNWRDRLNAIELMVFEGYSIDRTANRLHYSRRTVQGWWNDFINEVGKNMGFD